MYAIALLQGMVFYGPIATLYRQAQGVSIFQITLIESISLALCIILEVPWGVVADKIGYKRTMVFCSLLYFASKLVFWQAESFGAFLTERIMLSVVIAGLSGVDSSILFLSAKGGESQKVFGVYNALGTVGLLSAAAVFALWVGDNYKLAGALTVISYGLAAALSLGLKEVKGKGSESINLLHFKEVLKTSLSDKKLIIFLLAVAFLRESHQTITVFLNQLQYEKCGLTDSTIGYIFIAVSIIGLSGAFSHRLTRKLKIRASGLLFYVSAATACLALALTDMAIISALSIMLLRLVHSLFEPMQLELQNRQILTKHRATALSIYAMIIDSVAICTNLSFGALAQKSLPMAFGFGTLICTAGAIMFLVWHHTYKQKEASN